MHLDKARAEIMGTLYEAGPRPIGHFKVIMGLGRRFPAAELSCLNRLEAHLPVIPGDPHEKERRLLVPCARRQQVCHQVCMTLPIERQDHFHVPSLNRVVKPRAHDSRFDPLLKAEVAAQLSTDQEK
jgi:hypothetical protein